MTPDSMITFEIPVWVFASASLVLVSFFTMITTFLAFLWKEARRKDPR